MEAIYKNVHQLLSDTPSDNSLQDNKSLIKVSFRKYISDDLNIYITVKYILKN
jgi:hypothetical protein